MKNQFLAPAIFAALVLSTVRCTHAPVNCEECQGTVASDWALGDDSVSYVNRFSREPATVQTTRYKTKGDCGGFPRIDVKTAPGFCVGLVYDGSGKWRKLRWAAEVNGTRAVVTEMGGWAPFNGQILQLDFANGKATLTLLITRDSFKANDPRRGIINEPNQISRGPDGLFYVGAASGVYRFDPQAAKPATTVEVLVGDIPSLGLHPLKSFTFDSKGNLFVNVGAASNVCQNFTRFGDTDPKKNPRNSSRRQFSQCPEVEDMKIGQGQVRRYTFNADRTLAKEFTVYAKGVRNSLALIWDETHGALLSGDNGRDAINKFQNSLDTDDLPHERINVLREGGHYGWPYCYDNGKNSPEWKNVDCAKFDKAQVLIPAHSAPLSFLIYNGSQFPSWYSGRLLSSLHGYAPSGHRIVTFLQDENGLPTGVAQSLVYDWEKRGEQGMGKPVGLTLLQDGSVLIVEDDPQNKILRLFYDPREGEGAPIEEINHPSKPTTLVDLNEEETRRKKLEKKLNSGQAGPFSVFQSKVIDKTCYQCHQGEGAPGVQLLRYDDVGNEKRIRDAGKLEDILKVVSGAEGAPAMPPQGWDSPEEQAEAERLLKDWLAN
jgi:glucose/arabinose dehydrogenase